MTALVVAAVLTTSGLQRLELEPPRPTFALTIDRDDAERIRVNPWLAAPAALLLGLPLTVNFIVGEAWLVGGAATLNWPYVGYGALSVLPVFGPWILYLIDGPTPFGQLWAWVDPARDLRKGVLVDAIAQTAGAALMIGAFLWPGAKPREPGFQLTGRGLVWVF